MGRGPREMGDGVGLPPKLQPWRASSSAGRAAAEAAARRRGRVMRKRMVVVWAWSALMGCS